MVSRIMIRSSAGVASVEVSGRLISASELATSVGSSEVQLRAGKAPATPDQVDRSEDECVGERRSR